MRFLHLCLATGLVIVGAGAALHAQTGSVQLAGVVRDQHRVPVSGATVTIIRTTTNHQRSVVSDSEGAYVFPTLPPGEYQIEVTCAGYRTLLRHGIRLETGEAARADLELMAGGMTEMVTVSAGMDIVRSDRATLGLIVDQKRIADLPLNGRTYVALIGLAPGVALPPGSQLPRINGGRPRTNEYLYDGISVLQPEPGQVAFFPIIDAIEEFRIESNSPSAEFGRFNGGVINLTTKSGTNGYHGTGFEFLRHEKLNARNVFSAAIPAKPRFRRSQFGGVFGGPIRRDHVFFFVDYQGQRQTINRTLISTVPTALQRRGGFTEAVGGRVPVIFDPATTSTTGADTTRHAFPDNVIPIDRIDPVARALLERYPMPTSVGTVNNYRRDGHELNHHDQFDVRVDQQITTRDHGFVRLSHFQERVNPVTPLPDGSGVTGGTPGIQRTRTWAFASNYQHTFSDRLFNELRVGDSRRHVQRAASQLHTSAAAALGLNGLPSHARFANTLPTFIVSGYQQLGSPPNTATDFETSVTHMVNALTWVRGRHTVKLGVDFRWERLNVIQPASPAGLFQFSSLFTNLPGVPDTGASLASFLLGQVEAFSIDLQENEIRNRAHIQEYFLQDDWRIGERLTVNGGLRYTLNFPSVEERNQAAVFDPDTQKLQYLGRDGNPRSARRLHHLNVGPRLGVVARMSDEMVARSGYGLVWIEQAGITTPFTTPVFPFVQTTTQRTTDGLSPAFQLAKGPTVAPIPLTPDAGLGQGVFAVDRHLGSGYVQQWNLSLQRAISPNTSVEIAYAGSHITRVGIPDTNINQLTTAQLALGTVLLQRVPNPYVGLVPMSSSLGEPTIPFAQLLKPFPQYATVSLYRNNVGTTNYHGVEVRFEHRLSRGLSAQMSYTRSRLIDDASAVFDVSIPTGPAANAPVADSFNRRLERDYSTGDIPHVFVSSFLWQLPYGTGRAHRPAGIIGTIVNDWSITGVVTLQSGSPIPVTQATNFNAFAGFGTQRPNLVGDPALPGRERSVGRWFNTEAFAVAPQFTLGTSSRNPIRGPSYRSADVAVIRRLALQARHILELRAEIFNVTNTAPLGPPNGVFGTPAFGTITSAGDPRVIQLALKYIF